MNGDTGLATGWIHVCCICRVRVLAAHGHRGTDRGRRAWAARGHSPGIVHCQGVITFESNARRMNIIEEMFP